MVTPNIGGNMAGPHIGSRGGQPRIQVRHRLTGVQSSHSVRRTVRRGPHRGPCRPAPRSHHGQPCSQAVHTRVQKDGHAAWEGSFCRISAMMVLRVTVMVMFLSALYKTYKMIIYDGIWKVAYKPAPCRMTNDVRQSMANTALRSAALHGKGAVVVYQRQHQRQHG